VAAAALLGACNDNELNEHQVNPTAEGTPFTDAEGAQVLLTANMAAIAEAQAAHPKLADTNAQMFAQRMIDDHSTQLTRQQQAFAQAGVTPAASDTSTMLQSDSAANVQTLQTDTGGSTAYDLTYLCMQVRDQGELVQLLTLRTGSLTTPGAVAAESQTARALAQMNLSLAQQLIEMESGADFNSACAPFGGVGLGGPSIDR
jgi:hypothetical protein